MHLLPVQRRSLDAEAAAVDLDRSPADILILSFSDSDLGVAAGAWERDAASLPSLRLVNLNRLRHPFSVDLLIEKTAAKARFVLVRLLGGLDYWRYGAEEMAAAARRYGFTLAILSGDHADDERLDGLSTLDASGLRALDGYLRAGGIGNMEEALRFIASRLGASRVAAPPRPVPIAGVHPESGRPGREGAPHALLLFYRSALLADDIAPVSALADALAERGARVSAFFVSSLKDKAAVERLEAWLAAEPVDVILNTTAFSAQRPSGRVTDQADAPVLQVVLSTAERDAWMANARGLGAADLAMNVVLPEVDGRIAAGLVSFKAEAPLHSGLEFARVTHRPDAERVARVADRALAWAALRRTPRAERRLACILSDYPGKQGRAGQAVGLDTPASAVAIAAHLRVEGFAIGDVPTPERLMQAVTEDAPTPCLALAAYRDAFAHLPQAFADAVTAAWGDPGKDPACVDGAFRFRIHRSGKFVLAVQPDRGAPATRRADYHDTALPPRHGYVAFYLWLRKIERLHAMIHLGTHGTLEWLPGKAVALGADCAPDVLVGALPVIYPFIVNNPGEAAQAKRRIGAVTVGHLTPPLVDAGLHGETAELEQMFDEYAEAVALDGRRARLLAAAILDKAESTGALATLGRARSDDREALLATLDAWLCDLKAARIGDGLHVFGAEPPPVGGTTPSFRGGAAEPGTGVQSHASRGLTGSGSTLRVARTEGGCATAEPDRAPTGCTTPGVERTIEHPGECGTPVAIHAACALAERDGLVAALDGRFVPPGPSGTPAPQRLDVLPTGRNLFSADPRAIPTRTGWEIGRRMAEELVTRHAQDHGDWPRRVVLDLWGSATMRTGGQDLAQAMALVGTRPTWDHASGRVTGFDILPLATLGRSRVDVTLRISGLFRDTFPEQIALFDAAVRAVAALDEEAADNPLAEAYRAAAPLGRLFGAAPGRYGTGLARTLAADDWASRDDLGAAYLAGVTHAYGKAGHGTAQPGAFASRVATADAFSHTGDLPGQDLLESDVFAQHEGGFAAAAALLGANPVLYRSDTTVPDRLHLRSLGEDLDRAVRTRAGNPRWVAGQMRHGFAGAAAIAETLDALYGFAATSDVVSDRHFDAVFAVTLGDAVVRAFLETANPAAARAMAERFDAAVRRDLWICRRNSTLAILADLREPTG